MAVVAECPFCRYQSPAPAGPCGTAVLCPKCFSSYPYIPREEKPEAGNEPLAGEQQGAAADQPGTEFVRVRCPHCHNLVLFNRRKKRKRRAAARRRARLARSEAAVAAPVAVPVAASELAPTAASAETEPAPQPLLEPPPPPLIASPRPAFRTWRDEEERKPFVALQWLVTGVVVLVSAGLASAAIPRLAPLVLPLASLGLLGGAASLVMAFRSGQTVVWPGLAGAYGTVVVLAATFFPGLLGPHYDAYRQPKLNADAIQVIPRQGQPVTAIPKDTDWVDASKYALQRNQIQVEIQRVTVGPVEVRTPAGARRMTKQPYLVIWLRRRQVGDAKEFADNIRSRHDHLDAKLELAVSDSGGNTYPRHDLDLAQDSAGIARQSAMFPVSLTGDVAAFAAPAEVVESLRLEVSAPQLGSRPLRFTIPRSMIFRQK